jgi:hypothetical protein
MLHFHANHSFAQHLNVHLPFLHHQVPQPKYERRHDASHCRWAVREFITLHVYCKLLLYQFFGVPRPQHFQASVAVKNHETQRRDETTITITITASNYAVQRKQLEPQ